MSKEFYSCGIDCDECPEFENCLEEDEEYLELMEEDYDVLLIDIKMPVINGKEFYQNIEDRYPKLLNRVIFTTGDVVGNDTRGFLKQSGRPILLKPFTPDELQAIVKETLSRWQ